MCVTNSEIPCIDMDAFLAHVCVWMVLVWLWLVKAAE